MANVMLCYPNYVDDGAPLPAGAWSETLPAAHALDPLLGVRARSVDSAPASTVIAVDLNGVRPVRSVALIDHNLSVGAVYRVTGSNDAEFADIAVQTAWAEVWSVIYPYGSLPWEHPNFWAGRPEQSDVAGWRADLMHVLDDHALARYWRIEIHDDNPAGYVEFGRLFVGGAWQPQRNLSYGNGIGFEHRTDVSTARSGAETFDVSPPVRVARFSLDWLSDDEAMGVAFEMQRQLGIHREVLFVHDPADALNASRRSFLGRLRRLSAIEHPYHGAHTNTFEIKEIV